MIDFAAGTGRDTNVQDSRSWSLLNPPSNGFTSYSEKKSGVHRRITLLIHADPVNEALHRGLLRSYRTQGLDSDALTANRRYRALMQRLLGGEPPAAALALVSALP